MILFKNYLKTAFRSVFKYKGHSFINIAGLATGLAACLLLFLWIEFELSYDLHHENADRIYRAIFKYEVNGNTKTCVKTPAPLGPALVNDFPEVLKTARFGKNRFLVKRGEKLFYEDIFFADPEIFDVFTLPLVKGDPSEVLKAPNSLIISEKARAKYFGDEDPIGKTITLFESRPHRITGVFMDMPRNSHFRFDFLGLFTDIAGKNNQNWGKSGYYTYLLTSEGFSPKEFEKKITQFVDKYRSKALREKYNLRYTCQELGRIHLHSQLKDEIEPNSSINTIYTSSAIALLILLIASLNYINLTTARYTNRVKEIGVRKVLGASRKDLVNQFLGESFLFLFIALPVALLLTGIFLPRFNALMGKQFDLSSVSNLFLAPGMFLIVLCVGLFSGIFPALLVSTVSPVKALKGTYRSGSMPSVLRKLLVVFQFVISIALIVCSLVVAAQLNFMRDKKPGFDKENVLSIPIYNEEALKKYKVLKNEFAQEKSVVSVNASNFFPGKNVWNVNYWREDGSAQYSGISYIAVDHDFIATTGITLVVGRGFSLDFPGDTGSAYILNQAAVKEFGWKSPIGKGFKLANGKKGVVIGVVKDFHVSSLHQQIKPTVLYLAPQFFAYLSIKLAPGTSTDISRTIDSLGKKWQKINPGQVFEYAFWEDALNNQYSAETKFGMVLLVVATLAILIACLGLFGLASYVTEMRKKEVGIRKILGATVSSITFLLSREFSSLVLTSNIAAWPIAWLMMDNWLQLFAYRIDIPLWTFIAAGAMAFIVSFLAVSYQTVKTAVSDPVKVLKYE